MPKPRRRQIVLDTNVIVAGVGSAKGASGILLSHVGRKRFDINISVPLILEYEEILNRVAEDFELNDDDISEVLDFYCRTGKQHRIHYLWRPFLIDTDDDLVLEVAIASHSEFIVTHNIRDFAGVAPSFGIRPVTPVELLRELELIT